MAFDVMRGFGVGQALAGQNALGTFAKGLLDKVNAVGEMSMKSRMEMESQKQLIPMKEASAMRLMQEKARLFPPQPKALSGEAAGRLSLSTKGEQSAKRARSLLFPTGEASSMDRRLLTRIHTPWGVGMIGSGDAQMLEFYTKRAIDAQLRSETGATAPPAELDRMTKEFLANAIGDPNAAFTKLSELESGLGMVRQGIDPTGMYGRLGTSPFEQSTTEDLSGLSDEEILKGLE